MSEISGFDLLQTEGDFLEKSICGLAGEFGSVVYTYAESEFGNIEPDVEYQSKTAAPESSSLTPPEYVCFPTIIGICGAAIQLRRIAEAKADASFASILRAKRKPDTGTTPSTWFLISWEVDPRCGSAQLLQLR